MACRHSVKRSNSTLLLADRMRSLLTFPSCLVENAPRAYARRTVVMTRTREAMPTDITELLLNSENISFLGTMLACLEIEMSLDP